MNRQEEIEVKTERLVEMLRSEKLGGVLLNSQPNFAWLTAGANNGIDTSRENGAASLLVRDDGKRFVLASRIEMPRILAEEIAENSFEPIEFSWEEEKSSPSFLIDRAKSLLNENKSLGTDLLFAPDIRVVEGAVARCRYELTESEIERYRSLGKDTGKTIDELAAALTPGQTEQEIARLTSNLLAAKNIRSVVTLVAADERLKKYRHPVPTDKAWEKVVMIVVCARRNGLIASLSRIVAAGKVPDDLARKTNALARVNSQLLAATRAGATGAELYQTAADAYEKGGFKGEQNFHHQGGATGYRTRDWVAHPRSTDQVQQNQAFAWNPSISGTKIEETSLLLDGEIEIITTTPDFPQISVEIDGKEFISPNILSL